MKTVFSNDQVIHLWANRSVSHDIRSSGGNLYTQGGALYSYGRHFAIAAFVENKAGQGLLLWNDASYGPTTSKHQARARCAAGHIIASAVHVPQLDWDTLRNRKALAEACAKDAVSIVEMTQKARQNRPHMLQRAIERLEAARQLYVFEGDTKAAAAVPSISGKDASKEETAGFLMQHRRAENIERARREMAAAAECLTHADVLAQRIGDASPLQYGYGYAKRTLDQCDQARDRAARAAGYYKAAGIKPAPALARIAAKARSIYAQHKEAAARELEAGLRQYWRDETRAALRAYAQRETIGARGLELRADRFMRGEDSFESDPHRVKFAAGHEWLFERIRRLTWSDKLQRAMRDTVEQCDSYEQEQHGSSYSIPSAQRVRDCLQRAERYGCGFAAYVGDQARAIAERAETLRRAHAERERARHAERIERWRAGESVQAPRDVPIMARIRGDVVETSWGASVPLPHAVRLVRIAERIAARGGQRFDQGDGPKVGYFQVSRIGADMSATIGCHEFTPEESARIVQAIKAHPSFATIGGN